MVSFRQIFTLYSDKRWLLVTLAPLVVVILSGCAVKSTPPGPNAVGGRLENVTYTLLQWPEGLTVMIWDDIDGTHSNEGSGSTSDPVFKQRGRAQAADGRGYEYQLETTDGKTAHFSIDGQEYELLQGTLFLIKTGDGETQIQQLDHDLSGVVPTNQGCEAFALENSEVARFMRETAKR